MLWLAGMPRLPTLSPLVPALLVLAPLAGCAGAADDHSPSLALRPAELKTATVGQPEPPAPVVPEVPPSADIVARIAQLTAQARAGDAKFAAQRPGTTAAVNAARGTSSGAEAWSVAQVALAALDSSRADATVALADLDRMYIEASTAPATGGPSADRDAVGAARDQVDAIVAAQNQVLVQLHGTMGT